MKNFVTQAIFVLVVILIPTLGEAQLKVMTFNIRFDNPKDEANSWDNRKKELTQLLDYYSPEIFGIQEGLNSQLRYVRDTLMRYNFVGVGRDDGKQKGEYTAIFFDTTKVDLLQTKTFWLSKTPDKISIGWDASMERICTYGVLKLKETKKVIHVFNAHYDHIGKQARKMSSKLIAEKIKELGLTNEKVIVMGDFNSEPDTEPILILQKQLDDAAEVASMPMYGSIGTFNSFKKEMVPARRIDYIFTKNIEVNTYRHIDDRRTNGLWVSDHLPVMIEIGD